MSWRKNDVFLCKTAALKNYRNNQEVRKNLFRNASICICNILCLKLPYWKFKHFMNQWTFLTTRCDASSIREVQLLCKVIILILHIYLSINLATFQNSSRVWFFILKVTPSLYLSQVNHKNASKLPWRKQTFFEGQTVLAKNVQKCQN